MARSRPATGWQRAALLGAALLITAVVPAACGEADSTGAGMATTSPTSNPSKSDKALNDFTAACAKSGAFRQGQVDFPRTIDARVNRAVSYDAAIDIRSQPAPAEKVIDTHDPKSEPIAVECVVGARLVDVGDAITVQADSDSDDGWSYSEFTPSGVLQWSWTITPKAAVGNEQLRLEIRPAVKLVRTAEFGIVPTSANYLTTVNVSATWIDRVAYWFQTQWSPLKTVASVLGVALLAVLAFSTKVRESVAALFRRDKPTDAAGGAEQADPARQPAAGAAHPAKDQAAKNVPPAPQQAEPGQDQGGP